ncbi:substrate-binding periplasmic protein [Pseudodesulfovibrio portus]|uniref:Amino acid ABC transporter substrate-binding protein n=1 Tax=Pseudodesulfovibrio portus TaxID=231439 RepID=A0ABN6RQA9_9BACT|nr:ABC transporter substrate-binding protein [Pseudodesulfovibrio portus]BDQ33039.1 amino acid ABC transporter substrate-binding protein [Pseudodesulfovibrio portus]
MRTTTALIFTLLFTFLATTASADSFTALAAPYPPYSVSKGLTVKGVSVAALNAIMEMCGTPLSDRSYKLTPWAYAYECAARTPRQIIVNAKRTPVTEPLYKWVGPVMNSKIVLIGRRKDNLVIPFKSDLKKYRIAAVRWSRPEKALLEGGFAKTELKRTPTHVKSLRMLGNGEVDLFATNERGAPSLFEGLGMALDEFVIYHVYEEEPLYFAFSRDTDDRLISRLNKALEEFKSKNGAGQSRFGLTMSANALSMK